MTTIKLHTDLQQSKKLAEILPLESADMRYDGVMQELKIPKVRYNGLGTPCWSLAALLELLKDKIIFGSNSPEGWFCCYTIKNPTKTLTIYRDSLIDACYEIIIKLKERNLI